MDVDEEDWKEHFTPLFVEFLSLHAAFEAELSAAGADAALVAKQKEMSDLLNQAERVLLEPALRKKPKKVDISTQTDLKDESSGCSFLTVKSVDYNDAASSPNRSKEQRRLQEYLEADSSEQFTNELPDAFVDSVRGWEIPGKEVVCSSSSCVNMSSNQLAQAQATASNPFEVVSQPKFPPTNGPVAFKSSLDMYDFLYENRRRKHLLTPWEEQSDVQVEGKMRLLQGKQKRALKPFGVSAEYLMPSRPRNTRIDGLLPDKVVGARLRMTVREYLIQWKNSDQLSWLTKKKCPPQAKLLVEQFNAVRKAVSTLQRKDGHTGPLCVVNRIVTHRMRGRKKDYLVKWEGYDSSENTWESEEHLRQDVNELVEEYERRKDLREDD